MRGHVAVIASACALGLALAAPAAAENRYELAGGCYELRSEGRTVAREAGPFRMQATALGRYLFYGKRRDFLAGGSQDRVESAPRASEAADWRIDEAPGGGFRITLPSAGKAMTARGDQVALGGPDTASRFQFERAPGCPAFPEIDVSATGTPAKGARPYGEVRGLIDAHMHMMAFEFLGGDVHCGRPWHPFGVEYALVDCPDHYPNGGGAVLENALSGGGRPTHDPVGWPTFKDWPNHASLTHEGSYYKWLERAWMGGLRVFVNLLVDNAVLCELYPLKRNSCNEMDGVRLQARRLRELQDYIDAQNGGPGKGWFRIVSDPFQARRVINAGKLAVVPGIEVSKLFDCGIYNDQPECDRAQIDRQLAEVYRLGVRQMELINKFDNALGGVAGDGGTTGVVTNSGNRYETGRYWELDHCEDPASDKPQVSLPGMERDALVGNAIRAFLPPGTLPLYPDPPHCNRKGLTDLGEYVVRRMMDRKMIVDPDHLSVRARNHLLSVVEAKRYSGIVSSHSWSTEDSYPRIYKLGGVITPYAGSSTGFVKEWRKTRAMADPRFYFGFGYGADMNGFGAQGGPRNGPNPVKYPFKSFDGAVTLDRQRSGQRVYDINTDGVDHYGLYPDWVEDLRKLAGDQIIKDLARGAEAYLDTWERAEGIQNVDCRAERGVLNRRGGNRVRLGASPEQTLRSAGQPGTRQRAWRWCVKGPNSPRSVGVTAAVFTPRERVGLLSSTAPGHKALGYGRGARVGRIAARTRPFGRGLRARRLRGGTRLVFGVRRGRITFTAVAAPAVARTPARLRGYLRLAGLR